MDFLPLAGDVCAATEALILEHNPSCAMAGGTGIHADWTIDSFDVTVDFSHQAWRGRMRSCNGIGVSNVHRVG